MKAVAKVFCLAAAATILRTCNVEGKRLVKEYETDNIRERADQIVPYNMKFEEGAEKRGIITNLFQSNRPSYPSYNSHETTNLLQPPAYIPDTAAVAPSLPVPAAGQFETSYHQNNQPSLISSILSGSHIKELLDIDHDRDKIKAKPPCLGLNMDWVKYALQKCGKINPNLLTAIFPSSRNQLGEPKMYYFENSTSNLKTWNKAQEWCTQRGMQLVTVNDVNENTALQEKLKEILGNAAAVEAPGNSDVFWLGHNDLDADGTWTGIGDSSSTFTDWHAAVGAVPAEPNAATDLCAAYAQRYSRGNIHFDARTCTTQSRFICEVSDECTALLASRYPKSHPHMHHHHHHHLHHN